MRNISLGLIALLAAAGIATHCESGGAAVERLCSDGLDNDADGAIDCADADCIGTAACQGSCNNNGTCDPGESATSCPQDCTTGPVCGNTICEAGEDASSCPQDCATGPVCGNTICEAGEDAISCPQDCATGPVCNNGICETGEVCDGGDLCGETCVSQGFDGGTLSCAGDCGSFVTTNCTSALVCDVSHASCVDPDPCLCYGCVEDGTCNYDNDDCVCADCAADSYCSNTSNCTNDGVCDPYYEGCVCADCAAHPMCP